MIDVCTVADWFLSKSPMTHKKLQKLCYYAQAWHCALCDKPLFADEIQAWVHGPVIPALYAVYENYNWFDEIAQKDFDDSSLSDDIVNVLNAVYDAYGDFDDYQLERLTHIEAPWREARGDLDRFTPCTAVISCDSMREFYSQQLDNQNEKTA